MSAIQNHAIQNIISREINDTSGLRDSTQQYKQKILNSLGIEKQSGLFSDIKKYIADIFNLRKIK